MVIPETYGPYTDFQNINIPIVIFNQNSYYSFQNYNIRNKNLTYNNIRHIITVSEDSQKYLQFVFPEKNIHRIRLGIDYNIFNFPNTKKKFQIAYMPRKLSEDIQQIIAIIRQRQRISHWKFIEIDNKNEEEVSNILKDSAIFLSLNYREGFGLPPIEAMACGCIVIGYRGRGGTEYFKQNFTYPIPERDIISFVRQIENTALDYEKNTNYYSDIAKKASDFVLNNYNIENEEQETINTWKDILVHLDS